SCDPFTGSINSPRVDSRGFRVLKRHQSRPRSALNTSPKALLMMRRYLPALLLVAFAFVSSAVAQSAPPNIVVILADDLGYGDVGFNGCPDIPPHNIDSIAANGVVCTNE